MGSLLHKALICFCVFVMLLGLTVSAVAIWIIVDSNFISYVIGAQLFLTASSFLLIGGIIVFAIAIFGLIAVSKKHSLLIKVFLACLLALFVLLILGAILAVVFKGELETKVQESMKNTLITHYGSSGPEGNQTTHAWDKLQERFQCCGVKDDDWKIYRNTSFYKNQTVTDTVGNSIVDSTNRKKYVPESCCVYNNATRRYLNVQRCQSFLLGPPGNLHTKFTNNYLYDKGCYVGAKKFLLTHSWILVALGFAFSAIMISGFVMAVFFLRRLNNGNRKVSRNGEVFTIPVIN